MKVYDIINEDEKIKKIRYYSFPDIFVAKPNHESARIYINKNKDYPKFLSCTKGFMQEFGSRNKEFHYKYTPQKLLIEEYFNSDKDQLEEFKCWVFKGKVELIAHSKNIHKSKINFDYRFRLYNREWNEPDVQVKNLFTQFRKKPRSLGEMIDISETLSTNWDFMRVDLMKIGDELKFGEMTPTPKAGKPTNISLKDQRHIFDKYLR